MKEIDEKEVILNNLEKYDTGIDGSMLKSKNIGEMYNYMKLNLKEDLFIRIVLETKVSIRGAYNQYIHVMKSASSPLGPNNYDLQISMGIFSTIVGSKVEDDLIEQIKTLSNKEEKVVFMRLRLRDLRDIHTNIAIIDEYDNPEDKSFQILVLHFRMLISHLWQVANVFDIDLFEESEKIGFGYIVSGRYGFPRESTTDIKSNYKIAPDNKTDFIKVISAMYDCRLFETEGGKIASNKQRLIEEIGAFFNVDLKNYSTLLSKAKASSANFLDIFDKLKEKSENYYTSESKKTK